MFPFFQQGELNDEQKAQVEKFKMHQEAIRQQINNWFENADLDSLQVMHYLMSSIAHSDAPDGKELAMYQTGIAAAQLRYKHYVDPGTGESLEKPFSDLLKVVKPEAVKAKPEPELELELEPKPEPANSAEAMARFNVSSKYNNGSIGPVICISCDTEFPSLDNRMQQEGCATCAHKSAWGW